MKWSWLNWGTVPEFAFRRMRKTNKIKQNLWGYLVAGKIWTQDLRIQHTVCVCVRMCVVPAPTFGPRTWSGHPQASVNMTSFPSTLPVVSYLWAQAKENETAYIHFIGTVACKWAADSVELYYAMPCALVGNKLTPWSRVLLEKLPEEMPCIYVPQSSITVLTRARHQSLRSIQSTPLTRFLEDSFQY